MRTGAMWRALFPTLVVLGAGVFAYRDLIGYDPYAGFETVPDETEAFFFAPSGSSPLLMALVTVWLVFNRRYRIRDAYGQPPLVIAAGLSIVTAAGFYLWATYIGAVDLLVVSLIFMVLGAGALLGGRAGIRALWLPAVFMLLLLPHPAEFINHVVFPLQLVTARIAVWTLGVLGIPAFQVGDLIFTESRLFQVIEACSGLRSIETMAMSGVLYAELFYRSRLQVGLIVVAGPLVGFLVNQLRVLSLILNPYSKFAAIHTAQGMVMLVGGVLLLAVFDWVLGRVLPVGASAPRPARTPLRERGNPTPRFAFLVLLLGTLGTAGLWGQPWEADEPRLTSISSFPSEVDGWHVSAGLPLDREFIGSVGFSGWMHRKYERDDEWVEAFVGSDRRLRRRASLLSQKTRHPGSGWTILERQLVELESGRVVEELDLRSRNERRLALHWREQTESVSVESLRSTLGLDQSPLRRPGRAMVFRVSTDVGKGEAGHALAQARLQEFARLLWDFYE